MCIRDRVYYAWDSQVGEFLQPGSTYEAEVKEGKFPKLTSVRFVASANGPSQQAQPDQALRREAIELALRVVAILRPADVGEFLRAALRIERFLAGDDSAIEFEPEP